jgi:hypothetical protein
MWKEWLERTLGSEDERADAMASAPAVEPRLPVMAMKQWPALVEDCHEPAEA